MSLPRQRQIAEYPGLFVGGNQRQDCRQLSRLQAIQRIGGVGGQRLPEPLAQRGSVGVLQARRNDLSGKVRIENIVGIGASKRRMASGEFVFTEFSCRGPSQRLAGVGQGNRMPGGRPPG